jgi:hypothetical protein
MGHGGPEEPFLAYATRASRPTRQSGYAYASLAVSAAALLCEALSMTGLVVAV